VPRQYGADVAQVDQRVLPFGRAFRRIRQGVGDPDQQIGWFNPRQAEAAASRATATKRGSASALVAISRRTVPIGRMQGQGSVRWDGGRVLSAHFKLRD